MNINKCNFLNSTLSTNTSSSYDERFIEVQYRAGNAQRAYTGTDNRRLSIALDFIPMSYTDKETLLSFYLEVGLVKYFNWTPIDSNYDATNPSESKVWRFSVPLSIIQVGELYTASTVVEEQPNATADNDALSQPFTADTYTGTYDSGGNDE